ncbi:MAG: FHA domain-containing protein [Planctomycetes bacterium]|nr:FHA domain-containing protein [Planctomycetota bacterium]
MIRFTLEIIAGPAKGATLNLDPLTPFTLGADPKSSWVVPDPQAKPLHARLTLEHGAFWLENLSSGGTVVDGMAVMERTPLAIGSTIAFGETVLRLSSNAEKKQSSLVLPLLIAIFLLGGLLACLIPVLNEHPALVARRITNDDWHKVYEALNDRLKIWDRKGQLPLNFLEYFHHAWFCDCSGDKKKALRVWRELYVMMAVQPFPGLTPPGKTIAAICPDTEENLYAIMRQGIAGYAETGEGYFTSGDELYMRTLWWFVGLRIKELSQEEN